MSSAASGGGGNFLGGFGEIAGLLGSLAAGGFKGRPQWRDLQFMNDAQNRLWPDEIKRQGTFLEGIAPSQGKAYNAYMDETYSADTARQTERMQTMAKSLGMSPWELTGAPAAAQLPPGPSQQQGQGQMSSFLQGVMPLQLAKLQALTQLQSTKMQTDTQKYVADQSTGKGQVATSQIAETAQRIKESASRIDLNQIQGVSLYSQVDKNNRDNIIATVRAIMDYQPQTSVGTGGLTTTQRENANAVLRLLGLSGTTAGANLQEIDKRISQLPPDQFARLKRLFRNIAEGTADMIDSAGKGIGDFLKGIGG